MYWYDGKLINSNQFQIDVSEPGLLYGATVFTTMRVYKKSLEHYLTDWFAHCDRLRQSIKVFQWQQPQWSRLKQGANLLLEKFTILRMVIFPDGKELITGRNLPEDLVQRQKEGIVAWVATGQKFQRSLAQHKTGNYLSTYLARHQALKLKATEAILIDNEENWLETSTGNLWGWRDGSWHTPHLSSGILPGIARSHWLDYFRQNNIPVTEEIWNIDYIKHFQCLAYSNCVVEIIPIKEVLYLGESLKYEAINLPSLSKYDDF